MINRFKYIENIRTILAFDTIKNCGLPVFTRMKLQKEISFAMNLDKNEITPNEELLSDEILAFIVQKIEETEWEAPIRYEFNENTRTYIPIYKN